jgi:hypothetical protein
LSSFIQDQDRAHAEEIDLDSLADRLVTAFKEAERVCQLSFRGPVSIPQRAEAIVRAAKKANLNSRLYELAWTIRKFARSASA